MSDLTRPLTQPAPPETRSWKEAVLDARRMHRVIDWDLWWGDQCRLGPSPTQALILETFGRGDGQAIVPQLGVLRRRRKP